MRTAIPVMHALPIVLILFSLGASPSLAQAESYFDWISNQAETIMTRSYRNQAEIDGDVRGPVDHGLIYYDPSIDAAKMVFVKDEGDAHQMRPHFGNVSSGSLFLTWESYWPSYWDSGNGDGVDGIKTHKSWQLSDGNLRLEVRTAYRDISEPTKVYVPKGTVGFVDIRPYYDTATVRGNGGSLIPMAKNQPVAVLPEMWHRYFLFVDLDKKEVSLWVANSKNGTRQVYDRGPANLAMVNELWFEFDSSQDRVGPETYIAVRNFAVLRNPADVGLLVARGAMTEEGGSIPRPPVIGG